MEKQEIAKITEGYCPLCGAYLSFDEKEQESGDIVCPRCKGEFKLQAVKQKFKEQISTIYAPFWKRFLALIIDDSLLFLFFLPTMLVMDQSYSVIQYPWTHDDHGTFAFLFGIGVAISFDFINRAVIPGLLEGHTIGKFILGIRIQIANENYHFLRLIVRWFVYHAILMIGVIGLIMQVVVFSNSKQSQTLHDAFAGTYVINGRKLRKMGIIYSTIVLFFFLSLFGCVLSIILVSYAMKKQEIARDYTANAENISEYFDGDVLNLLSRAESFTLDGDPESALPLLEKARNLEPNSTVVASRYCWVLIDVEDYESVKNICGKMLKENPNDVYLKVIMMEAYYWDDYDCESVAKEGYGISNLYMNNEDFTDEDKEFIYSRTGIYLYWCNSYSNISRDMLVKAIDLSDKVDVYEEDLNMYKGALNDLNSSN